MAHPRCECGEPATVLLRGAEDDSMYCVECVLPKLRVAVLRGFALIVETEVMPDWAELAAAAAAVPAPELEEGIAEADTDET